MNIKERPRCRKVIITRDIKPLLINGEWDGRTLLPPHMSLSSGMKKQMKKMIEEGYFK